MEVSLIDLRREALEHAVNLRMGTDNKDSFSEGLQQAEPEDDIPF